MGRYIPSTGAEQQELLAAIGVDSVNAFFKDVPDSVLLKEPLNLPAGKSELEVRRAVEAMSKENKVFGTILRGAGAYQHYIPSIVKYITAKEEFVTAYTPYQAEMSQGILQSLPPVSQHPLRSLCWKTSCESETFFFWEGEVVG